MIYNLHSYFCNLPHIFTDYPSFRQNNENKKDFQKSERNVGMSNPKKNVGVVLTQEVNVRSKIKQTAST